MKIGTWRCGCQDESDGLWKASKVMSIKGLGHSVAECCEAERVLTKALFETLGHHLVSLGLGKSWTIRSGWVKTRQNLRFSSIFHIWIGDAPILAFKWFQICVHKDTAVFTQGFYRLHCSRGILKAHSDLSSCMARIEPSCKMIINDENDKATPFNLLPKGSKD